MNELNLYVVDYKLVRDYSRRDENVMSVSPQIKKQNRPFIGILVVAKDKKYCVPISSPKPKHKTLKSGKDMVKIFDMYKKDSEGNFELIGILNINNMIPIDERFIKRIDISNNVDDSEKERQYKGLLRKELSWCRDNIDVIYRKVNYVYGIVNDSPEDNRRLVKRSVNFKKLEEVLENKLKNIDNTTE